MSRNVVRALSFAGYDFVKMFTNCTNNMYRNQKEGDVVTSPGHRLCRLLRRTETRKTVEIKIITGIDIFHGLREVKQQQHLQ